MRSQTKDSLLYLLYGHGPHNDEGVYAILSALHHMGPDQGDYRIVVYTDDPDTVGDLPVHTEVLTDSVLAEWSGPFGFNHRRKIVAMKHALERFGGRLLFCDSDTWFAKHPRNAFARVRPGHTLLHVVEYHLSSTYARTLAESLGGHAFRNRAGRRWSMGGATTMFNSGVIGLHESDMSVLDEVLYLTDQMYFHAPLSTIEQLAFSVCLKHYTSLRQSYDVVYHYWPPVARALFREHLSQILHDNPIRSREEQFRQLLPRAPRVSAVRWGGADTARTLRVWTRVALSRAAELAGVKDQLKRIHHVLRP